MKQKVNNDKFINKAKSIHGDKYDYSKVNYINSRNKIIIICLEHGEFEQSPDKHIYSKNGCPKCSGRYKLTNDEFINKAKSIHGDKYDYSKVNYVNIKNKIIIICPKHGEFKQQADSHINQKSGCPKCVNKHNYSNYEFIERANKIHNDKYIYDEINYINNYTKVNIICPLHGSFTQTPSNHLSGKGCTVCSIPKNELILKNLLNEKNIKYHHQHTFDNCKNVKLLPFDFYLPDYNICIEYNGKQHYEPIEFFGGEVGLLKQNKRDNLKIKFCKENNIKLLIIKYDENTVDMFNYYYDLFIL
jgi:hypothetical protein